MDETSYIKGVQKEPFADVLQNCGVLKIFAKFTGKHGDSRTCVHWSFTKHFSELSYHFFPQSTEIVAHVFTGLLQNIFRS